MFRRIALGYAAARASLVRPCSQCDGDGLNRTPHYRRRKRTNWSRATSGAPGEMAAPLRYPAAPPGPLPMRSVAANRQRPTARTHGSRPPDVVGSPDVSPGETVKRKRAPCEGPFSISLARPERFELPTFWFVARHSIQLSYGRVLIVANCTGGERGIRTLEGLLTLTPLAGARLRPLGHLSGLQRAAENSRPGRRRKVAAHLGGVAPRFWGPRAGRGPWIQGNDP